ncbi:MAG: LysE family transporter [Chloroflexi bacterium]|nr:LysE family transporter [Anaerolineaceae bacterium]NMB91018.1 LysE family transporter [Chloroflexota bacterium]
MFYFTQGIILGLYAAVSPGPLQAFLFAHALRYGWKRTLPAALAPIFSDGPVVVLFLLLFSQAPDGLLTAVRLVGGLYLLWMAWGAYQARAEESTTATDPAAGGRPLVKAAAMNLLNPNVYIFWGTIGAPIVLEEWERLSPPGVRFLGAMYGTMIPATALLILLFSSARRLNAGLRSGLNVALAGVLLLFGLYQLWQAALALGAQF